LRQDAKTILRLPSTATSKATETFLFQYIGINLQVKNALKQQTPRCSEGRLEKNHLSRVKVHIN